MTGSAPVIAMASWMRGTPHVGFVTPFMVPMVPKVPPEMVRMMMVIVMVMPHEMMRAPPRHVQPGFRDTEIGIISVKPNLGRSRPGAGRGEQKSGGQKRGWEQARHFARCRRMCRLMLHYLDLLFLCVGS